MILSLLFLFSQLWSGDLACANNPSYRLAHPMAWMHLPPVGEQPGWSSSAWLNLELTHANIWNNSLEMTDRRNGNSLRYEADFEQTIALVELGRALTPRWAMSLELPYSSRGGGVLDDFIDQFHAIIGSERFLRHRTSSFANNFDAEVNGADQLAGLRPSGVGNIKLKSKWWLWQWQGSRNGSCACGLSVGGQVKFPVQSAKTSLTSGHNDYSLLLHLGAPLFQQSGVWATAAFSSLGRNEAFKDWPRREFAQMYELSIDLALNKNWGLLMQARTESPIMNKSDLSIVYPVSGASAQASYRVSTGWNSLVYWRSSQSGGLRWRSDGGSQINFLVIEDWGLGSQDSPTDKRYVTNAPDVAFSLQTYIKF